MRRREGICLGAAVALHAAALAWLPVSLATKRDAGLQAPAIRVTLMQAALTSVNAAPAPPSPAPAPTSAPEIPSGMPPKPLVDKPVKSSPVTEPPTPTDSSSTVSAVFSTPSEASNPVATASPTRGTGEVLAAAQVKTAAPVTTPTPIETARPDHAHNPPPDYPALARRFGLSGRVLIRVLVEASGEAREVMIAGSSGHAVLDQAALKSVRSWRFLPARRGADSFAAWVEFPVKFELTN